MRKDVVVWDYHVVLLLRLASVGGLVTHTHGELGTPADLNQQVSQTWVYDFDTRLPLPCDGKGEYSINGHTID